MTKKILISLAIIGVVAAITVGLTTAYFSDTETSTGNTFTAGAIDLEVDNHCWYNGYECINDQWVGDGSLNGTLCSCTWDLKDLDGELFFDFEDLKPGDWGEDTVSLHVHDNDAWGCVAFDNLVDYENGCTEPEEDDGDQTCENPGAGEGELSDELYFVFWADMCNENAEPGDNKYQDGCESILMSGSAGEILGGRTYTLAAPEKINIFTGITSDPLVGGENYYIGKAWCYGSMPEPQADGSVLCNGALVSNLSQTDSLTGDITFYIEQARNNSSFSCEKVELDMVDIGEQTSMSNHDAQGWFSDPGNGVYGGRDGGDIAMIGGDDDDNGYCDGDEDFATFELDAGTSIAKKLIIRHLDGSADDTFKVYVNGDLVGTYTGGQYTGEQWVTTSFNVNFTGNKEIKLIIAGDYPWTSCETYGQGAINWAKITN